MVSFENLHEVLLSTSTGAFTSRFQPNNHIPTLILIQHQNVVQHASTPRSQHVAWWCLHREMGQLVYLSYRSIALYLYIQETHVELNQDSLSTSTLIIFETDFSKKIGFTTTIPTKSHKSIKFSMLFGRKVTPLSKSSHMAQYLLECMFIYYILGVVKLLLFGWNINAKVTSYLSNMSSTCTTFVYSRCLSLFDFVFVFWL